MERKSAYAGGYAVESHLQILLIGALALVATLMMVALVVVPRA